MSLSSDMQNSFRTGLARADRMLPEQLPELHGVPLKLFRLFWFALLIAAVVGPIGGLYIRSTEAFSNSWFVLGSRAGIAVPQEDATLVRFPVGPYARSLGIKPGDEILAINRITLPDRLPVSDEAFAENENDPTYSALEDLFFGEEDKVATLTVRSADGAQREVPLRTGEHHIDRAATALGITPALLNFISMLHVIFYPVLLWIAVVLALRNPHQLVAAFLSIAIIANVAAEQPASTFWAQLGVPRWLNVVLFDVGNIALIAGILLFPTARLRPRLILLPMFILPLLFFLQGEVYQLAWLCLFAIALTAFVKRLRASAGDLRQQMKFLFFGVASYPLLRGISILADFAKLKADDLGGQIMLETAAALFLALASLSLFLFLFAGVRRHRLYDAEHLVGRSALVATITLVIAAVFALSVRLIEVAADKFFGATAGVWGSVLAAGIAAAMIKPLQRNLHHWAERGFQHDLFELRSELPKRMDDLRETENAQRLLSEALQRLVKGTHASSGAAVFQGEVIHAVGIGKDDAQQWLAATKPGEGTEECARNDPIFPIRLPIRLDGLRSEPAGWLALGPRPDGTLVGRDERIAIISLMESVERAIRVAAERETKRATDLEWRAKLEGRLLDVERELAALRPRST